MRFDATAHSNLAVAVAYAAAVDAVRPLPARRVGLQGRDLVETLTEAGAA